MFVDSWVFTVLRILRGIELGAAIVVNVDMGSAFDARRDGGYCDWRPRKMLEEAVALWTLWCLPVLDWLDRLLFPKIVPAIAVVCRWW